MTEAGRTDRRNRVGVQRRNVGVNRRYVGANRRYVGVNRRDVGVGRRYVRVNRRDVGVGRRDVGASRRCVGVGMDVTLVYNGGSGAGLIACMDSDWGSDPTSIRKKPLGDIVLCSLCSTDSSRHKSPIDSQYSHSHGIYSTP